MKVGGLIDRPRFDDARSITCRGKFARMCVEIDISKSFIGKFKVERCTQRIEYEGIHLVCFYCKVYRHKKGVCPSYMVELNAKNNKGNHSNENGQDTIPLVPLIQEEKPIVNLEALESFGLLMLVTKKTR